MCRKLFTIFCFAEAVERGADGSPSAYDSPLDRRQRRSAPRNDVHEYHESGHRDRDSSDEFIMFHLIRTRHRRLLLPEYDERNRDHAVRQTAGEVSRVADPQQHLFSEEGSEAAEKSDHQKRIDRCFMFLVQFSEERRNHVGDRHRVHRAASSDQEGIPACDDSAESAHDQNLRHHACIKCLRHRICRDKTGP